jgi:hypothetical protein
VDTGYTSVSVDAAVTDVQTYHHWAAGAGCHVDGIFFDDVSGNDSSLDYYQTLLQRARSAFGSDDKYMVLNAGTTVTDDYFTAADNVVVFEDFYSSGVTSMTSAIPDAHLQKATFLVHHIPNNKTLQASLVRDFRQRNVGGLYLSTSGDYDSSGTPINSGIYEKASALWSQFCAAPR